MSFTRFVYLFLFSLIVGCASKSLNYEEIEPIEANREFDNMVKVKEIEPKPVPKVKEAAKPKKAKAKTKAKAPVTAKKRERRKTKKTVDKDVDKAKVAVEKRAPKIEDSEGFNGRRPLVDPYIAGEKITLDLTYLNMKAGQLVLETLPFVEVNGAKSYHFRISIKSSSMFAWVYEVNDIAETFMDYSKLIPYTLNVQVKESKQLKEIKSFFDWKKLTGNYWETKITKEHGKRSKKKSWKIEPFSQNVISAPFYLRTFTLTPGKTLAFRVADAGKNLVFRGKVLRKEKIDTVLGEKDTVVVQPKFTMNGVFKPVGDIFFWLTDDEHKHIVRIESKIKIGSIVAKLKSIELP